MCFKTELHLVNDCQLAIAIFALLYKKTKLCSWLCYELSLIRDVEYHLSVYYCWRNNTLPGWSFPSSFTTKTLHCLIGKPISIAFVKAFKTVDYRNCTIDTSRSGITNRKYNCRSSSKFQAPMSNNNNHWDSQNWYSWHTYMTAHFPCLVCILYRYIMFGRGICEKY